MLIHITKKTCFYFHENTLEINCIGHFQKCIATIDIHSDEVQMNLPEIVFEITSSHLNEILASVTKKDRIEFIITQDKPNVLVIRIVNNSIYDYTLHYSCVQRISPLCPPLDFDKMYSINTTEFQCIISRLSKVKSISIDNVGSGLKLFSNDIISRSFYIGGCDVDTPKVAPFVYEMEQLTKFKKLTAFAPQLKITSSNYITIYCPIANGSGAITIYIKSKELQDEENCKNDDAPPV